MSAQLEPEPLLTGNPNRLALFPIEYPILYEMYLKHVRAFWHSGDLDFRQDQNDWREKLSAAERRYLSHVLAFFATSEATVMDNLAFRFMHDVKVKEAQHFYCVQLFMESVHSETYSKMIDILLSSLSEDPSSVAQEKAKLFGAVQTVPSIKAKADYARFWIESKETPFAERLLAFMCIEGIGFIPSFASIFWLKKRGLLPGVCQANEYISRDESLHYEFGLLLYLELTQKVTPARAILIIRSFVNLELAFVKEALDVAVIGMNAEDMMEYVMFIADRVFVQIGLKPFYQAKNPFPWMQLQGMDSVTNFFEKRVTSYQKNMTERVFTTDDSIFDQ